MGSVNKVIIVGHLGADPELKQVGDTQVCNLRIATSKKYKDRSGQMVEKTEWHRVNVWGKQAEACHRYLQRGRQVYVEGELETRSWEKDGEKRYSTEIRAAMYGGVVFLGKGGEQDQGRHQDGGGRGGGQYVSQTRPGAPGPVRGGWGDPIAPSELSNEIDDSLIPF